MPAAVFDVRSDLPWPFQAGVLPVDKPSGWTSFDVVKKLRGILGVRRIGHAGTLDPLATGLLICCVGSATKDVSFFTGLDKEYRGTLRLGERTASYDSETPVLEQRKWDHLSDEEIAGSMKNLEGEVYQIPPMYAAIKVGGMRLYHAARKGKIVERAPRLVSVYRFEFLHRAGQDVAFRVHCSKGTYVRSMAHDMGESLGCGAHLIELRRTRTGGYRIEDAWSLPALQSLAERHRQAVQTP